MNRWPVRPCRQASSSPAWHRPDGSSAPGGRPNSLGRPAPWNRRPTLCGSTDPSRQAMRRSRWRGRRPLQCPHHGGIALAVLAVLALRTPRAQTGFQAPLSFDAGGSPSSVAVGDFNGDGKPDFAVANMAATRECAAGQRRRHLPGGGQLRRRFLSRIRGGGGFQRRRHPRPWWRTRTATT